MKSISAVVLILVSQVLLFTGCETPVTPVDHYQPAISIEGVLIANERFDGVIMLKTLSLIDNQNADSWDFSAYPIEKRISGAGVRIISEDSTFTLTDVLVPGLYQTDSLTSFIPQPGAQYDLYISNDSLDITATTTLPYDLRILRPTNEIDTLIHGLGDCNIELKAERAAGFFVFIDRANWNELYSINYLISNDYVPNNNWFLTLDSNINIPWNYFSFLRRTTKIWVWALDENLYDYYAGFENGKLDPNIPLYNINSDNDVMGYFGSALVDSFYIYLEPGDETDYICLDQIGREITCP